MDDVVIEVRDLTKSYGPVRAVAGIDFDVHRGEVFALLGPNGAGKTTTLEILQGFRRRSGGEVEVLGVEPTRADDSWRSRVGIVHQDSSGFTELKVGELVRHFATFFPDPLDAGEVIDLVGLGDKVGTRCSKLSGGQRRRLDVALGIVGHPELVFLDEPTTGLDPQARRAAWRLVERLTGLGATVLLTTHYLEEAEVLADRLAIIIAGRIEAEGTPAEVRSRAGDAATVQFRIPTGTQAPPGVNVEPDTGSARLDTTTPTAAVAGLAAWAGEMGLGELPDLTVTRPTLEDVYLGMVSS